MSKNVDLGANILLNVVHNNKSEVLALLLRNGVVAPSGSSDVQVAQLVTDLLKKSKTFYAEFMAFLANPSTLEGLTSSMNGYANVGGEGVGYTFGTGGFYGSTDPKPLAFDPKKFTATTKTDSKTSQGFDWGKVYEGLQFGVNSYLQADKNKTDRALANASVANSQNAILAGQGGTLDGNKKGGSNTALWVVLAIVGVAVVGGGIYFATKKK
jgi:hypothetical protein